MWLELFNDLRKKSGMSLDEISAKSGVPKGTLAKITSGVTKAPPLETMRKLVHSMGYTLNDIDPGAKKAPLYSSEAMELAADYDGLDRFGKQVTRAVVDIEKARCDNQGKVKLYIAARDGSRIEAEIDGGVTLSENDTQLPE